jgi:hypothetical protein
MSVNLAQVKRSFEQFKPRFIDLRLAIGLG